MPGISQRAQITQASPIRKLKPLADQAIANGKKIYNLNIGQPDIPTPKSFIEGAQHPPDVIAYTPSQGIDEAVQLTAKYYESVGIPLSASELIITTGGSEAISYALLAICDAGDEVLVPEPFYTNYNSYATMADVVIVPIETSSEDGFHLPSRESIEAKITPRTKAILFCSPGNPTGTVYSEAEMNMLGEIVHEHNLFMISDEVYREFVYDGQTHTSAYDVPGVEDRVILVDSISKRLSACGARIGAIGCKNGEVYGALLKFAQARLSPPTFGQLGLINFLKSESYKSDIDEIVSKFERRRNVLFDAIEQIPGAFCLKPEGAFYVILRLPVENAEDFCKWLLSDFDLDGDTAMLAPAEDFYSTPGKGRDEVRIAYVLNEAALVSSMEVLKAALAAYPAKTSAETIS